MPQTHQPDPAMTVDDVIGLWTILAEDGQPSCTLALNRLVVPNGFGVHIEDCAGSVFLDAGSWRLTADGFALQNAEGRTVQVFRRTGVDAFTATEGTARMQRAPLR